MQKLKNLKMSVKNMAGKNCRAVPNQFILSAPGICVFQSYNSVIVIKDLIDGKIYLDEKTWDYSLTTGKYRNKFLGETKKETEAKIKNGTYILTDLN